jgi:hypothetical protein
MTEIAHTPARAADPAPIVVVDSKGANEWAGFESLRTEPVDVAVVDAVTRLFAQMERTALAQRPVVVHQAPAPHPGVDVRMPVPAAPVVPTTMTVGVDRPHNPWPLVFMVSGCTGLAAATTAAATGSSIAILAVFASVATWGAATYQLVFKR